MGAARCVLLKSVYTLSFNDAEYQRSEIMHEGQPIEEMMG